MEEQPQISDVLPARDSGYTPFVPDPTSFCLCGSGKRYQHCCKGRLPGFNNDKKWRKAAADKRWGEMIRHLRADVTQYTIWHLDHTAPAILQKPELREAWLMKTDIEALADYVENLMWGYARKGWLKRLADVLERLAGNIDDPRWRAKIAYLKGIAALWQGDRECASQEIAVLQPITPEIEDVDLLQIHVDLHGREMGMIERLAFFDRIRTLSKSKSDKLQYGGARAFEILMSGDEEGARRAFDEVIELGREQETEKPFSSRAESWFCHALEGRALFDSDAAMFAEIDERLTKQLGKADAWTPVGRAGILRDLGNARRYARAFRPAINAYREAQELVPAPELRTFEAECELGLGNLDEAFRLIRSVAVDKLGIAERADHAFTSFYIALARGDERSLMDARDLLKAAKTPKPFFETKRLQHIVTIGEALDALKNQKPLPELTPIMSGLKRLSRYIMLQPNWNGIGINGNLIIEDVVAYVQDRSKDDVDDTPIYPEQS